MGNYISQNSVYLSVRRFLTLYNVENRAAKELARQQEKPKAAPKYDAGHIDYHKLMKGKVTAINILDCDSLLNYSLFS